MNKVKEYANWVYTMIKVPINKRKAWVSEIMTSLRTSKGTKRKNPKEAENLANLLESNMFKLAGFSANLHYIKHDKLNGDIDNDMNCVFVHPWASPKLLFKHKTLPVIMVVGDDLRLDESVLDESDKNVKTAVRGFTG